MDVDTLVRHGLPVVIVVGNNGIWGLEKHPMQALYGYDVAADLQPGCRYDEVVRALGGAGEIVERPATSGRRSTGRSPPACPTSSTCSPTRPTSTRGRRTSAEADAASTPPRPSAPALPHFSRKRSTVDETRVTLPAAMRPALVA